MRCQELCARLAMLASPVSPLARLNILICQYQLGHYQLIPERVLPLISHVPPVATLAFLGLALPAAHKADSVASFKQVALALASPENLAFDLPSVPTFVVLQGMRT